MLTKAERRQGGTSWTGEWIDGRWPRARVPLRERRRWGCCRASPTQVAAAQTAPAEPTLYDRLGGYFAIAAVVNRFSDEIITNPKLNENPALKAWNETQAEGRLPGLKFGRTLWIAAAAGGPFDYTGLPLTEAHAELNLTADEFAEVGAEIVRCARLLRGAGPGAAGVGRGLPSQHARCGDGHRIGGPPLPDLQSAAPSVANPGRCPQRRGRLIGEVNHMSNRIFAPPSRWSKRGVAGGVALAAVAGVFVTQAGPFGAGASSHREAPLIAGDPRADNTDVYAFVSPDKPDNVTLIANWIPFEEPNGGPNFYTFADDTRYNIKIDNDGDALADLTYTWVFDTVIRDADRAVPLQHRSGHVAGRRRPERVPDVRPHGHGRPRPVDDAASATVTA